ncbi:MAG: hypothetical protein Q8K63_06315, partial [Acidimicrobiales bacterium]|nr:hypothetical protein [Acidimicrobiales bacterium]
MLDASRRAELNFAKLKVLAQSAGANGLTPLGFPGGAAASGDARDLWVFGETSGVATLGGALSVALKGDLPERLVVITDSADDAGVIARRAGYFASPAQIDAASVDGTSLAFCEGFPSTSEPNPSQNDIEVPDGVDVVVEHGVVSFEVKGLEIGRLEDGELAVGVGKHDREGHRMANPDQDPLDALRGVAERVRKERRGDTPGGAMTSYSRERWLRSIVVADPGRFGLPPLTPVAPALPRADLRDTAIAPAVGDGVVVAFSVGVDPDLVPSA